MKGGNWQIFEQFVKRSKATVYLTTTVCLFVLAIHYVWLMSILGQEHCST